LNRAGRSFQDKAEMARIDQALSQPDLAFGLVKHQKIRLANSILYDDQHYDSQNDNTGYDSQDGFHNPYLLRDAWSSVDCLHQAINLASIRYILESIMLDLYPTWVPSELYSDSTRLALLFLTVML
jgi:hypothetical protein